MAFIPIIAALISAAATTGSAVAGSVEADNANKANAALAQKNRAASRTQNALSNADAASQAANQNALDAAGQSQNETQQSVSTLQGAGAQRQNELDAVSDSIAKNLTGMGH